MTPKELVSKIDHLVMNYEHKYIPPETDPMNIIEELIQQAKSEWESEAYQKGWFDGDMGIRNQVYTKNLNK